MYVLNSETTDPRPRSEPSSPTHGPRAEVLRLKRHLEEDVLGQPALVERLLLSLLCDGHLLVEGAPGLAKTRAIKTLSAALEGDEHRIQFTPDLLPADLTGTDVFQPDQGTFRFEPGPLFHNLVLADEINRAPAKVQSALLEAMAERQVTVGRKTHRLPRLFLVMATQNPIEQEGTYPLPEAQLDRFLMYLRISPPDATTERRILRLARGEAAGTTTASFRPVSQNAIFEARDQVLTTHLADPLEEYIVQVVMATRRPDGYGRDMATAIQFGASPRATIALDRCARAKAWLDGRTFVTPDDVRDVLPDVLRHRIILTFEADAEGITGDDVVEMLLSRVPLP